MSDADHDRDPKAGYRIPLGRLAPRPDPETCDHRWVYDEDALTGEGYLYCVNRCGALPPRED
jgi:hypothetical protein